MNLAVGIFTSAKRVCYADVFRSSLLPVYRSLAVAGVRRPVVDDVGLSTGVADRAPLSGAAAARHILDAAGLQHVAIEPVAGQLSDHYDPSAKVLRLKSRQLRRPEAFSP